MAAPRKYPDELRERVIRLAVDARRDPATRSGALKRIGEQLGINPETLRNWVIQAEIDDGHRPGTTTDDVTRLAELEREVRELRRANAILKSAGFLRVNASMRGARRGSLVSSLPRLRLVACPAMCGPAGFWPGGRGLIGACSPLD